MSAVVGCDFTCFDSFEVYTPIASGTLIEMPQIIAGKWEFHFVIGGLMNIDAASQQLALRLTIGDKEFKPLPVPNIDKYSFTICYEAGRGFGLQITNPAQIASGGMAGVLYGIVNGYGWRCK